MKIALLSESYKPNFNGAVNVVSNIKKYLEKKGHEVYLFTCGKVVKEKRVYTSPKIVFHQGYGPSIPYYKEREIFDKIELIHTHQPFTLGLFGLNIAKKNNIPLIATSHVKYDNSVIYTLKLGKILGRCVREYVGWFFRKCDAVIIPSKSYKGEFIKKYKVPEERIRIIPNFIEKPEKLNKKNIENIEKKYNLQNKKVLIFTGRISPEKNLYLLINSFKKVCEKRGDVILFIIGNGPDLSGLKKLVSKYKLEDKVIFTGEVPNKEVFEYLAISDVFVSTSKTETHSLSLLEAMSMKSASVTTKITGFVDITHEGKTGLLVEGENPEKFADKILEIISDKTKLDLMKNEAYKESKKYDIKKIMAKVEKLYNELIYKNKKNKGIPPNAKEITIKANSGKEFFLLHCYTGSTTDFNTLPEYLHKRFNTDIRVIRLKGHGESIKSLNKLTYKDFYEQSEEELKKELKKGKKIVLIGLSLGAQLALDLASKYPVEGVILVSMPYHFIFPFNIKGVIPLVGNIKLFKKYWKKSLSKEEEKLRKKAFYYSHMYIDGLKIVLEAKKRLEKDMENVKVPVLSIYSKKDIMGHFRGDEVLKSKLKSKIKETITINSPTHNIFYSPDKKNINKQIGDFIDNAEIFKTRNHIIPKRLNIFKEEWVNER